MEFDQQNAQKGAIPVGKILAPLSTGGGPRPLDWGVLHPGTDGYVLTASAAATQLESDGTYSHPGVVWAAGTGLSAIAASSLLGNPTSGSAIPEAITLGTGLSFSGTTLVSSGGGGTPGGTSGQIQYDNGGSFGGFTMSGDATLVTSTGAITVTKTSGAAFAASATTDTTNASNIASGILAVARGGTGLGTLTAHAVMVGEGTSTPGFVTIGTAGRVLVDQGASADPAFEAISGDATLTSTGALTIGAGAITSGKIASSAVSYAKIQNESGSTLLGNPTGSAAAPSEITLGTNLSFAGSVLNAASGGAANPGGSANQIQWNSGGTAFAGFTMSGDATLVVATGAITVSKTGGVAFATSATTDTTNAANIASGTLSVARGGTGVSSPTAHAVLLGEGASAFGTATIGTAGRHLIDQGGGADPAFEVISGDATCAATGAFTVTKTSGVAFASSATTDTTNASNISSGTLGIARGGTGLGTLTAHAVMIGEGTSTPGFATIGTAGRLLIDQGSGADPAFEAASGDVTVAASGTHTIAAAAVTLAKQANFAASSLQGNPTGSAATPSAITLGAGLSFSGTTLVASAAGTVTSVSWTGDGVIFTASADTPVTTSGTLTPASLIAQTAHYVLAGPTSAGPTAPTFRALAAADIPNLPASQVTSGQLAVAQGGTAAATLTAHAVLLGEGTSALGFATIGTGGRLLIDQGSGTDPAFEVVSGDATCTATGAFTVTKTSGTAFASSATVNACNATNITSGTLPAAQLPAPTASTLGGVEAVTAVTSKWINAISTAGVPALTQPAFTDVSGTATAAQLPTTGLTITEWTSGVTTVTGTNTIDFSVSNSYLVNLTHSAANTLTIANIAVGQTVTLTTLQDSTGNGTITWAGQTIRWTGGTAGQATATASKGDVFKFYSPSSGVIVGAVAAPNF